MSAQKITKNRKRDASNKEFELFIENNLLNGKISDGNVLIDPTKVSLVKDIVILDMNRIFIINFFLCRRKRKKKHDAVNAQAESEIFSVNRDSIKKKSLVKKIQQLETELKKKDETLSFASNQQIEHLEKFFEKKMVELEERLEKNLENKVKVVESVVGESINQFNQKISNIENMMSTSPATNVQKVLDWINNLPE